VSAFDIVAVDILAERQRQEAKWGQQNHDDFVWLAILMEEIGEAVKVLLDNGHDGFTKIIRPELLQAVAVGAAWLECIDRRAALRGEEET